MSELQLSDAVAEFAAWLRLRDAGCALAARAAIAAGKHVHTDYCGGPGYEHGVEHVVSRRVVDG